MVNHRPQKRQKIRPALQTPMHGPNNIPDPSLGGVGYDETTRRLVVDFYNDLGREGYRDLRDNAIPNIHGMPNFPAVSTVERYIARENNLGRNVRMRHTGNKRKDGIHGLPLFLLSIYRRTYPKATRYECTAYLYRAYGSTLALPRIYSLNEITEAENHIGLNRKKGSTTANQAFTHRNLTRRLRYWTMNFPDGIADIAREDMIDLDEAGLSLETANRRDRDCVCDCDRDRDSSGSRYCFPNNNDQGGSDENSSDDRAIESGFVWDREWGDRCWCGTDRWIGCGTGSNIVQPDWDREWDRG